MADPWLSASDPQPSVANPQPSVIDSRLSAGSQLPAVDSRPSAESWPLLIADARTGEMTPGPSKTEVVTQPPTTAVKSYAATVKGDNPYLLTVHVGTDERSYFEEELLSRLIDEVEKAILANQSEEAPELCCSFRRWGGGGGGGGLICWWNQRHTDYLHCIITGVKLDSKVFTGWQGGRKVNW